MPYKTLLHEVHGLQLACNGADCDATSEGQPALKPAWGVSEALQEEVM